MEVQREPKAAKGPLAWDGVRIAKKPGNAGGVKDPTAEDRERRNICYTLRWENRWEQI